MRSSKLVVLLLLAFLVFTLLVACVAQGDGNDQDQSLASTSGAVGDPTDPAVGDGSTEPADTLEPDPATTSDGDLVGSTPVESHPANTDPTDTPPVDTDPTDTTPETRPMPELPQDVIHVVNDWRLSTEAGQGKANSLALAAGLSDLPDGATVFFPEGQYEMAFPMYLVGKKNIRLVGHYATLIRTGLNNTTPLVAPLDDPDIPAEYRDLTASTAHLVSFQNQNLCVEGLAFGYDIPTSLSGEILSVSGDTARIQITDNSPVSGSEYVTVINTFTADGVPDRTLEQYAADHFPLEKLSDDTIRISGLDAGGASNLQPGTRVCLRLCTGREYVISAHNTTGVTFKDLTFYNSFNGGILLNERCANATLDGVTVASQNPQALMSLNADALHVAALTGQLTVTNCTFERPGDDCINVHSGACMVDTVTGSTVTLTSPRYDLSQTWGMTGDLLRFYHPDTFALLGEATITAVEGSTFTLNALPTGVTAGAVVANTALHPVVTIRNTTVKNTRARGFLLQTDQVTVEDCTFVGTALSAILVAPDLDLWYEMAPAHHVIIRGNRFENCGGNAAGVIQLTASHESATKTYDAYIHEDITVESNTFTNIRTAAVYALCTRDLTVQGNTLTPASTFRGDWVVLRHCEAVTVDAAWADHITKIDTTDVTTLP